MQQEHLNTRQAAIDTQLLFGYSCGVTHHTKALDYFRKKLHFSFCIPPSVMLEIRFTEDTGSSQMRRTGHVVLQDIGDSVYVQKEFTESEKKIIDIHVERILEKNIIPGAGSFDARTLVEAAYMDCGVFITTRKPLLDAGKECLDLALIECGMLPLTVISPKGIVEYFKIE